MTRRQLDPLRPLTEPEHTGLTQLSRSLRAPAGQVARAKALLAVAGGASYTEAALRRCRLPVSRPLQPGGPGCGGSTAGGRACRGVFGSRVRADSGRGPPSSRPGPGPYRHLVVDDPAPGAAPSPGWVVHGQYLYPLGGVARSGLVVATQPHLVPDQSRPAQAQAWDRRSP